MTFKTSLLRGAALGLAMTVAAGAAAEAKTVHHKKPATYGETAPMAPAYGASASDIASLRAEIDALKAQVANQQAAIADSQAKVDQVAADNDSVQERLDNVPNQILATVGELPKPKKSWAESTSVSGRGYFDFTSIQQKNNGQRVAPSGTAFDLKRLYVGVDHTFNDVYSANITLDFQYSSATSATEYFVKKAYLQAKYFPWLTVRLGGADMPWVPFVEEVYGNRFLEKTLIDKYSFGTSTDFGIHALGSLDPIGDPKTGPVVSYAVAVVNGTGFKAPPGTGSAPRPDSLDVEGRLSVKWYDFTAGIGGYHGRLGKQAGATFNQPFGTVTFRDASRFNAILAYNNGTARAGVEYFHATNWTALNTGALGEKADGYSVFGSYIVMPEWSVFGRYDYVKPQKTSASTKKADYFNLGVTYSPTKIVDLSLVYKRDTVENGTFNVGNGTIGNTVAIIGAGNDGTYDEVGLFGQFRW